MWDRGSVCSLQSSAFNLSVHPSLAAEGKAELPKLCSCPALGWLHAKDEPKWALNCFTTVLTSESSRVLCILTLNIAKDTAVLPTWKSWVTP